MNKLQQSRPIRWVNEGSHAFDFFDRTIATGLKLKEKKRTTFRRNDEDVRLDEKTKQRVEHRHLQTGEQRRCSKIKNSFLFM